ncbi:AGAP011225-PA-like protein [Anopheles sinensis]|uniref:AGAP011225-PA-like protein n=1 Tax=Anopheles sinensis TaxID=74873 RepID=A0A084VT15_ANOSI|nr:AGAP011225-PA-like protein [Anopheles sinensis]
MAVGDNGLEQLISKMNNLEEKLQALEQTMKTNVENSMKEMEQSLQAKIKKVESNFETRMNVEEGSVQKAIKEKLTKLEDDRKTQMASVVARIQTMEDSLKKVRKETEVVIYIIMLNKPVFCNMSNLQRMSAIEDNTTSKLENLKNQSIDKIHQQETALSKTYQEKLQTELKRLAEKKNIDDIPVNPVSSCRQALNVSGIYMLQIGVNSKPFEVFCEQSKFEGGWTVIQHRFDGSVDFYRNWTDYRNGFGNLNGEFWLGLEHVHKMTKHQPHELLIEMKDFHGNYGYAKYGKFEIGAEFEMYMLKKLGTYSGTAGDSLGKNKDQYFSTFDRDNDIDARNCAEERHGAWWYWQCTDSNLNGHYSNITSNWNVMEWYFFKGDSRGMSYSRMMIRDIIN